MYSNLRECFKDICNAIRNKKGTTDLIPVSNIASEIENMGGGFEIVNCVVGKNLNNHANRKITASFSKTYSHIKIFNASISSTTVNGDLLYYNSDDNSFTCIFGASSGYARITHYTSNSSYSIQNDGKDIVFEHTSNTANFVGAYIAIGYND